MLKPHTFPMPRQLAILAAACATFLFAGCGEKTAEQKNEALRAEIKDAKKLLAVKNYKLLAQKFPNHERAGEALQKASELEAKK